MNTYSLRLFLTLSETLHFGRASQTCHISPSSLSRQIKQLENLLGVALFERDNRSVTLTHEGEILQKYARESLSQWETLRDTLIKDSHQLRGALSIYCSVTASYSFLYDILSEFRLNHPKIEIKLHTGDPSPAINRVINGTEDIAIAARPDTLPNGLAFRRIVISPLVFIAPVDFQALPNNLEQWSQTPMILSEDGLARERVNRWFAQSGITPTIYAQVAGHEAIVSMVGLGFGIGVVPLVVLENSPLRERIQIVNNAPSLKDYDVGICVLKRRLKSPIVDAFWRQLASKQKEIFSK